MVMLAIAAAVALLLGLVGIYGMIAYIAAQRTREIAHQSHRRLAGGDVIPRQLRCATKSVYASVRSSDAWDRTLTRLNAVRELPGEASRFAAALLLTLLAFLAAWPPARRASSVEPGIAIEHG